MQPEPIFVARPHRLRVIAGHRDDRPDRLDALGWFALPGEIRALFTISQVLTLLGVLAALVLVIVAAASSYVRADASGLTIRNGLRRHQVPWSRVHKIMLRTGDPWALLLLTPATAGRSKSISMPRSGC